MKTATIHLLYHFISFIFHSLSLVLSKQPLTTTDRINVNVDWNFVYFHGIGRDMSSIHQCKRNLTNQKM